MAAKKESTFVTMVTTLLIISVVAASALSFVYELTKGPIAQAQLEKNIAALSDVLPAFENNPIEAEVIVGLSEGDSLQCYPAYANDELVGIAVRASTNIGYEGTIWVMVGFTTDGIIHNSMVLNHRETPGLGDKMEVKKSLRVTKNEDGSRDTTWWTKQFMGMKPEFAGDNFSEPVNVKVEKKGGEIDAITAATITSDAYCHAVNRAYHAFTLAAKELGLE